MSYNMALDLYTMLTNLTPAGGFWVGWRWQTRECHQQGKGNATYSREHVCKRHWHFYPQSYVSSKSKLIHAYIQLAATSYFYQCGQYLHPFEAVKYRQAAKDIRAIGRDCIKRRIKMIESGEQVPNDILTHILQIPCKFRVYSSIDCQ